MSATSKHKSLVKRTQYINEQLLHKMKHLCQQYIYICHITCYPGDKGWHHEHAEDVVSSVGPKCSVNPPWTAPKCSVNPPWTALQKSPYLLTYDESAAWSLSCCAELWSGPILNIINLSSTGSLSGKVWFTINMVASIKQIIEILLNTTTAHCTPYSAKKNTHT